MNELVPVGYRDNITLYGGEGLQWVDGETIGRLLNPASKDPLKYIHKAHERNKSHFTERDTVLLDIKIDHYLHRQIDGAAPDLRNPADYAGVSKIVSQKRKVRFFSVPHGVIKICKASRSKIAFEVIERMVDLHEAFIRGLIPKPIPQLLALAGLPAWDKRRSQGLKAIAQAENVHENTVRRRLKKVENGEPTSKKRDPYVHAKYRSIYNEAMGLKKQGVKAFEVAERLNIPSKTLYHWFKKPALTH